MTHKTRCKWIGSINYTKSLFWSDVAVIEIIVQIYQTIDWTYEFIFPSPLDRMIGLLSGNSLSWTKVLNFDVQLNFDAFQHIF